MYNINWLECGFSVIALAPCCSIAATSTRCLSFRKCATARQWENFLTAVMATRMKERQATWPSFPLCENPVFYCRMQTIIHVLLSNVLPTRAYPLPPPHTSIPLPGQCVESTFPLEHHLMAIRVSSSLNIRSTVMPSYIYMYIYVRCRARSIRCSTLYHFMHTTL